MESNRRSASRQDSIVLSIGGGPGRENPRVVNLNIDAFESVDIVGDGGDMNVLLNRKPEAANLAAVFYYLVRKPRLE